MQNNSRFEYRTSLFDTCFVDMYAVRDNKVIFEYKEELLQEPCFLYDIIEEVLEACNHDVDSIRVKFRDNVAAPRCYPIPANRPYVPYNIECFPSALSGWDDLSHFGVQLSVPASQQTCCVGIYEDNECGKVLLEEIRGAMSLCNVMEILDREYDAYMEDLVNGYDWLEPAIMNYNLPR